MKRVLIANRGEIALRAVRASRALGLSSVAVCSSADTHLPHCWAADHSVCIGPPPSTQSYLNVDALLHVAQATGCDAVYPGYGFLSENAAFAVRCREQGLKFVGPDAATIELMGDKARARQEAQRCGVPVVPGSEDAFDSAEAAHQAATRIGYPLLLKASAGGGGRGMRIVESEDGFLPAFEHASREARAAFGDGSIYLERFFGAVRHIEVQVLGDGRGDAIHLGERDCTVQRRHQKLVEEAPSLALNDATRQKIHGAAVELTKRVNYEGAGTVEFVYDESTQQFYFIEMNTRIQVEHPVTEMLTGMDLIQAQFRIAAGEPLPTVANSGEPIGHAIEFRINAEDWTQDFTPSPGRIRHWRPPTGNGLRTDTWAYDGAEIGPYYDSMIAKLIVHGTDRDHALEKARTALAAFRCEGIATTIGFHRKLLTDDDFINGRIHTRWVESKFLPPPG